MTKQDELLFAACCAGDTGAFGELVTRYQSFVASIAYCETGDLDRSEEIAQQTFVTAWEKRDSLRDSKRLVSWLAGITRNLLRSDYRQRSKAAASDTINELVVEQPSPLDRCIDQEQRKLLWSVLESLPANYREPLVLYHREGCSTAEVSRLLEISQDNVKQRLSRGRAMIRKDIAAFVENALEQSKPSDNFSAGVLAAVTSQPIFAATTATSTAAVPLLPDAGANAASVAKGIGTTSKIILGVAGTVMLIGLAWVGFTFANHARNIVSEAMPAFVEPTRFEFENGLKVILRPVKGSSDIAIVTRFDVGELNDPAGKSGLAHLIEHLYVTAATSETPARTVQEYVAAYPKGWNAQTGADYTVVATVFDPKDLEAEIRDVALRMSDLKIEQADIDREVPRMLQEVDNMFNNFAPLASMNRAHTLLHPRPHTGRKGGHPDQIKNLKLEEAVEHWRNFYKPNHATLVVAGDFDLKSAENVIRKQLGEISAPESKLKTPELKPAVSKQDRFDIANTEQPVVTIAVTCPHPNSKLFAAFITIVMQMQKDGKTISNKQQEFPVMFMPLDDFGTLYVRAWAKKKGSGKFESADEVVERLEKFIDEIDPKKVFKARRLAKQQYAFMFGTDPLSDMAMSRNIYGAAFGIARRDQLGIDGQELATKLDELTIKHVESCLEQFFAKDKRVIAIVE
jgi:zinc protease